MHLQRCKILSSEYTTLLTIRLVILVPTLLHFLCILRYLVSRILRLIGECQKASKQPLLMCLLKSDCNTILLNKSMNFFETKRLQHRKKRFHVARVIAPFCAKQNFVWRKKKRKMLLFVF